jgi:uncharacterized protein (TIGR02270 family)
MRAGVAILWDVFEEHLDEAAFLWSSWEDALRSPVFTPKEVASGPEERLLAHLHALFLGGPAVAARLLAPGLADPERAFPAAFALLSAGDVKQVLQALQEADAATRPAIQRALELHPGAGLEAHLFPLASKGSPELRAAALEVLAFRGVDPGDALRAAVESRDPKVIAAALRAVRAAPATVARPIVLGALPSNDAAVRDAAIQTGLALGLREAWNACRGALSRKPASQVSQLLAALGGGDQEQQALITDLQSPKPSPHCLWAAGFSGRRALADACIDVLSAADPRTARLAGEAFSAITGLRIEGLYLAEESPQSEAPIPFEEDDLNADLVPRPEDALPLPDAMGVQAWWKERRGAFDPATRYLAGKPHSLELLQEALEQGPMRRRSVLALELDIRSRGALPLETRRWVRDQRVSLAGFRASRLTQPFSELAKEV